MAYVTPQAYANFLQGTGGLGSGQTSWVMPPGGWNNQNAPRPQGLGVDALNAMAGQPGAAAQHYGFSTDANSPYYILGDRYLGKLQSDWSSGITTGGNKQIHKILTGLGSSYGSQQAFVKADPNLGSKFAQYFRTGDAAAAGITPARAKQAYDYALRATGRDAVLDRSPGFLGGLLKGNIGAIAGTLAGFAIPGIGPALMGALGGAIQGGVSGGLKGAALGGISGYGLGSGANWLAGKAGLPFAAASTANPAPIINKGVNLSSYTNSLASGPLGTGGLSGVLKGGAAAGNWGGVPATWANWGSQAANLPSTFNTFAGLSSPAASSGGFLSNILGSGSSAGSTGGFLSNVGNKLSGAFDMGTLKGWTNLGKAGMAGTAAYNYLNPVSGQRQMNELEARVASLFGNPEDQFQPYNVTTPLSQVQFDGENINVNPSEGAYATTQQFMDLLGKSGAAAGNVDTAGLSQDFYSQLNALKGLQEADEMRRLESVLFNRGGVHTGTQNQLADFQSRLDAARQSRQFDAINAALGYQGDLYNQFQGLAQGTTDFNAGLFNPYAQAAIQAGAYDTEAEMTAKKYLAGITEAGQTRDYYGDVQQRDYLNDALKFGFDFLGGL